MFVIFMELGFRYSSNESLSQTLNIRIRKVEFVAKTQFLFF